MNKHYNLLKRFVHAAMILMLVLNLILCFLSIDPVFKGFAQALGLLCVLTVLVIEVTNFSLTELDDDTEEGSLRKDRRRTVLLIVGVGYQFYFRYLISKAVRGIWPVSTDVLFLVVLLLISAALYLSVQWETGKGVKK